MNKKILVSGDINGNFDCFFEKINKIVQSKGPFSFLLCVGNFFGENSNQLNPFVTGEKNIPIKTYFIIDGLNENIEILEKNIYGGQIIPNLYFLGKSGVKIIEGIKVAYLTGTFNEKHFKDITKNDDLKDLRYFNENDFEAITGKVDILLTCEWPFKIHRLVRQRELSNEIASFGKNPLSILVERNAPKYHFAAKNGIFYQSPLFSIPSLQRGVRFVGLAGEADKNKSLFAFNYSTKRPNVETKIISPFSFDRPYINFEENEKNEKISDVNKKVKIITSEPSAYPRWTLDPPEGYICDKCEKQGHWSDQCGVEQNVPPPRYLCKICKVPGHFVYECPKSTNEDNIFKRKSEKNECWFCIDTKMFEKHLCVSIGEKSYLSLAKGGLDDCHCIICTIEHVDRSVEAEDALLEIEGFKESLRRMAGKLNKIAIFYERSFNNLPKAHAFLECIFITKKEENDIINKFLSSLKETSEIKVVSSNSILTKKVVNFSSYLMIESSERRKYVAIINENKSLPMTFLRELVCKVIKLEEKINWRKCVHSKAEEVLTVQKFKNLFVLNL